MIMRFEVEYFPAVNRLNHESASKLTYKNKRRNNMINLKYIVSAIYLTFSFLFAADNVPAQQTVPGQPAAERQKSTAELEKEKKQELRAKACGTESVNYKASTDKKQHPTPDAPADRALVYVMRTTIIGYKIHSKLAVDGKWMGVNRGRTYFFFTLDPGEHYFCSEAENQDYITLAVEAGKTYYLKQRVEPGVWKARTDLAVIDEEKAKKELADLNLSVFELKK